MPKPSTANLLDLSAVKLRPAEKADRRFTEGLYLATMLPLLTELGLGDEAKLRARFARGYKLSCSEIVVWQAEEIGWLQVSETDARLHLDQLHLTPAWRRHGIGTALVGGILERAANLGLPVELDVIRGNPALGLYTRLGFTVVGEDEEKRWMVRQPGRGISRPTDRP